MDFWPQIMGPASRGTAGTAGEGAQKQVRILHWWSIRTCSAQWRLRFTAHLPAQTQRRNL